MKKFNCHNCNIEFADKGYDNPVFLADTVANCPSCGEKCWEIEIKIPLSKYNKIPKKYLK